MIEQAVTITDDQILILGQFFVHKDYSVTGKDLLLDIVAKQYRGQRIVVRFWDGENTDFGGFENFIKYMCDRLQISYSDVTFETHNPSPGSQFNINHLKLGIFISVNQYLPQEFDRNIDQARFVGSLLGRYNITRLRLAYELDQAFPNDNFVTFQPSVAFINDTLRHVRNQYQPELAWVEKKTFDRDLISSHHMGMIDWQTACRNYGNVWNQYQIEVVSETDTIDNFWFTEKTANCLATGKPFVLVSGQYSLNRLQNMGFQTFNSIIDETYDTASTPYNRIAKIKQSLTELYNSPDRNNKIAELYNLAHTNINRYLQYIN